MASSTHSPLGSIDIRFATTAIERDAVFQLRHRVLGHAAAEMLVGLISSNGRLIEPADCHAELLAAFDGEGRALAAVRREPILRVFSQGDRHDLMQQVADQNKVDLLKATISSRFIIDPQTVGGNLALRLFASMLRIGMNEGVSHDFCWCDQQRLQWRLRLGYVHTGAEIIDDQGNPKQVLMLPVAARNRSNRSVVRLVRNSTRAA